jgi:hypothetical protein
MNTPRIPQTQLDAYLALKPKLSQRQGQVLYSVEHLGEACLFDLVDWLQWPVNCVSGRITELVKRGLLEDSRKRRANPNSGKLAIVWRVAEVARDR